MTDKKKNTSRSQLTEPKPDAKVQESSAAVKTPAREARRSPARQESKTEARQESKTRARHDSRATSPSVFARVRNSKAGRFFIEAYYELRHKVTWPTFIEARNMTIAVILISAVIGIILSLIDLGLLHLFLLITGGS